MRSRRLTEPPRPCEGEDFASAEARRWTEPVWQLSDRPRHPFGPPLIGLRRSQRWQVAAALSAAVTTTKPLETAPNSQAEPTKKKACPPNASRSSGERGLGGEGLLSEKPPLPPVSPTLPSLRGGSAREGSFSTEKLPSLAYPLFFDFFCNVIGGETVMNEEFLGVGGGLTEYVGNGDRL